MFLTNHASSEPDGDDKQVTATPSITPLPLPVPPPTPVIMPPAGSSKPSRPLSFAQLTTLITAPSGASASPEPAIPSTPSSASSGSFASGADSPSHERTSSLRRIVLRPIVKKIDFKETLETIRKYTELIKKIQEHSGHLAEFIFWMNETSVFLDETHLKEAFKGISKFKVKLKHAVKIKNAFSLLVESKKKLLGEERYFQAQQIILGLTYTQSESASVWVEHELYKTEIIENYRAKIAELNLLLIPPKKASFVPAMVPRSI